MRLTDIQLGFPFIVLAVTVLSVSRPSFLTVVIVLSLAAWPIYARVVRSIMMGEKDADYVVAGRAFGVSHRRIIFKYVGRPLVRPLSGIVTFDIANMIIFEAMLGFLAIGLQPPTISLGNILADGKSYLFSGYWWTVTMPGLVILILLLGINLLADGIQKRQAANG
jgi:peptide/nickel transport system permease protein